MSTASQRQQPEDRTPPSWRGRLWSQGQFVVALLVAIIVLVVLLRSPFQGAKSTPPAEEPKTEVVKVVGPGLLAVNLDSPLGKKSEIATVHREKISAPILNVTGTVAACLRPGPGDAEDRWQFNGPEVLSAFTDWQKSRADVVFAEKQLAKIRELNDARVTAQTKVVDRLRKLVAAGTDSLKDLAAEETNLLQAQLQGQKEVYEAETAVKVAIRARAALERQLQQAGVDPALLARSSDGAVIVTADVPEVRIGLVKAGQGCRVRFFGYPDEFFAGKVDSVAPILSRERRTLRVLFVLDDARSQLRPGMFAEIGLGTDPREALLVPANGIVHVGRSDYLLVAQQPGQWRVVEVKCGEAHGNKVEILEGLQPGIQVIGSGAILFKPFVIQALQPQPAAAAAEKDRS